MQRYYDELSNETRGEFQIIVDKTWEDIPLDHLFDDSVTDIADLARRIDAGLLDYFQLRVRVFLDQIELSSDSCGGFVYEDARETLTDGTAEDMIQCAIESARQEARRLQQRFAGLTV